jgi:universal stress protein A
MMSNYTNILVAIDINAHYTSIISKALTLCHSPENVCLMYTSLPSTYIRPYLYGMEYDTFNDAEHILLAREKLHDIATHFGIPAKNVLISLGIAAIQIKEVANEKNVDLIVIGTHGKSGIELLLGATANSVLHGVKQDVLAVRIYENT